MAPNGEGADQDLLRFITCGSVDDGKSTLIGRLLHDTQAILDDQMAALEADSVRVGTQGEAVDFALLVDGLSAEREQGITIDVAYRYFGTDKRRFIVADTPGHEQYTRNMVTGASTADLAVLLVDARKGVLTQTRRHSLLAKLVGVRRLVLAVTKMDLVDYDRGAFDAAVADYRRFAEDAGIHDWVAIPVSGTRGDNVVSRSAAMAWHDGVRGWYAGLTPTWRRELRIGALWLGFGLLLMPFLIYLAGVLTLGPYEGGLLAFLGSLLAAFFTAKPTAWLLVVGPYLLFTSVRLLSRPLRRPG